MKLWIRSQDKTTLINTRRIEVDDNNIIVWDEGRYASEIYLGIYKTKERAIEVLDEIQNFMRDYACVKKINRLGGEIDMIPKPILIYNMPKN